MTHRRQTTDYTQRPSHAVRASHVRSEKPTNPKRMTYSSHPNHAARVAHARADKMFRTYDTSAIQPKKSKAPMVFGIILMILIVGGLVFGALTLLRGCSEEANLLPSSESAVVVVPEGAGASTIASSLKDAGLIADTQEFVKRVTALGAETSLKPGTYTIQGGTTTDNIIKALQAGPGMTGTSLTIPEGYTLAQIATRVEEVTGGSVSASDFTSAASDASVYASDYSFLSDAGSKSLEGFLFPKTYSIDESATADSIIRLMLDQFKTEFSTLDTSYATEKGLSLYDIVNLASIVEKESTSSTRTTVASVFYNRLDIGMALQSDATTAYEVGHDPSYDEVHADTEYSTYTNNGLPPTPICCPGLESLQAVCSPEETSYYYFYFEEEDGEMKYYFSETNDEHNAAVFG